MDFLNFVNSNAVRVYLQEICYQPTSLEAAWLVYQCKTASLEEKCAAWREIIETLPDCPTGSRTRGLKPEHRDSVYTFLQAYIAQQEQLAAAFLQADEPAVYDLQYQFLPKGERFWRQWRTVDENFPTLEACLQAVPRDEGEVRQITVRKYNAEGDFLMAAKFLPDHRLAFAEPRPGSLYAMSMEKSEWAVYTGLLYPAGPSEQTLNFPLPFRPGDLLYDPNSPEATFCGGVFVAAQTDSYCHRFGFFQWEDHPDKIIPHVSRIMDCEYYPAEELTERHRLLSLLSEFLKGKQCGWDFCWDFTTFLTGYHDLLLPPPADSEGTKTDGSENKIFLSVEIAKVPEGTDEDDSWDWDEEIEEMEQEWDEEEAGQEQKS